MGKVKAASRACPGTAADKSLQGHGCKAIKALQTKKKARFGGATKIRGSRLVAKRAVAEATKTGSSMPLNDGGPFKMRCRERLSPPSLRTYRAGGDRQPIRPCIRQCPDVNPMCRQAAEPSAAGHSCTADNGSSCAKDHPLQDDRPDPDASPRGNMAG